MYSNSESYLRNGSDKSLLIASLVSFAFVKLKDRTHIIKRTLLICEIYKFNLTPIFNMKNTYTDIIQKSCSCLVKGSF